jgi:hypothetical protein
MFMADPVASLVKGTLDLLVLMTIDLQPLHGAAIAERIFQTSPRDGADHGGIAVSRAPPPGTERMDRGGMRNASDGSRPIV